MMFGTAGDCRLIRAHLGAFIDGELGGAEMLRVREHLDVCVGCHAEAEDLGGLGELLRDHVGHDHTPAMDGLSSGVVSRVRAERSASWRGMFERALDDWHWVVIGLGSVTATSFTTVLVGLVLWFGPAPVRQDSLSAMLSELTASDTVFVFRSADQNWDQMAWRVADGAAGTANPSASPVLRGAFFPSMSDPDLVAALAEAVMRKGRLIDLRQMNEQDRNYTEMLLHQIKLNGLTPTEVRLVSSTTVSAKGL